MQNGRALAFRRDKPAPRQRKNVTSVRSYPQSQASSMWFARSPQSPASPCGLPGAPRAQPPPCGLPGAPRAQPPPCGLPGAPRAQPPPVVCQEPPEPSLLPVVCQEPPEPILIPSSLWVLSMYGRDILSHMHKASITSTFGSILKMDSTKKTTEPTDIRRLCVRGLPIILGDEPSAFFQTCTDAADKEVYSQTPLGILCVGKILSSTHPEGNVVMDGPATLPQACCVLFGPATLPQACCVLFGPATLPQACCVLFGPATLPQTLCVLFGLIYALQLEYPKCMKNTFHLVQQAMLNLGQCSMPHSQVNPDVIRRNMNGHKPSHKAELLEFLCRECLNKWPSSDVKGGAEQPRRMKAVTENLGYSTND
ncbi:hypothetical protein NQZ68_039526 [Dissostichus eleginoides]|nr:hypothetical protein NQZ68_039526 [Dissostichus eleginoides]